MDRPTTTRVASAIGRAIGCRQYGARANSGQVCRASFCYTVDEHIINAHTTASIGLIVDTANLLPERWPPCVWLCPSQGDNYALALAYFQTGLPDGGFDLLQGNLMHDMYNYMSPGALGSHNGGLGERSTPSDSP